MNFLKSSLENSGCGGIVTAPNGEIHSPKYPSNYPDNVDCSWVITVDAGHRVFFNFTDLDLESHSSCSFDYVAVSSWPFCVHTMNLMLTVATFVISWYNRPMHHSLKPVYGQTSTL